MVSRPQVTEINATPFGGDSELQRITPCDQRALRRLQTAYEERSSIAFLTGDGKARSSLVIDNFLATLDEPTSVVRVPRPRTDAISCMRDVIRSIGFEVGDFSLTDLENIFTMYLAFQRTHDRRTVLCVEEAQNCSGWVFDKIFKLAELELHERYGLFVILSGQSDLSHHLTEYASRALAAGAAREIRVSPLALPETREFVVQQVKSLDIDDVSQVIEYEAIFRLHEISVGTADTVYDLCKMSLQKAAQKSAYPITASAVSESACELGLIPVESPQAIKEVESVDQAGDGSIRLIVRLRGRENYEQTLSQDCISIGRDSGNDVCLPSLLVSRHHALIIRSSEGVKLMDLGSTNGSVVNGEKADSCRLESGDTIVLGDCRIEFAAVEDSLNEIPAVEVLGSNLSNGRGIAINSFAHRRLAKAFHKAVGPQNSTLRCRATQATMSRGHDFRESPRQD